MKINCLVNLIVFFIGFIITSTSNGPATGYILLLPPLSFAIVSYYFICKKEYEEETKEL